MNRVFEYSQTELADMYLDWFNNYWTVHVFAMNIGHTIQDASLIINLGREAHSNRVGV